MARLLALILNEADQTGKADPLEVAELYRELGQFKAAAEALSTCNEDVDQTTKKSSANKFNFALPRPFDTGNERVFLTGRSAWLGEKLRG